MKILRGIFKEDSLSPLLLGKTIIYLGSGYKFTKSQEKINHFMYMDDMKLCAKNEKELVNLLQTIRIYSQNIGMKFSLENCAMLIM